MDQLSQMPATRRTRPPPPVPASRRPPGAGHRVRGRDPGQPGPVHRERGAAEIARDFDDANLGELSWVLNGYAIVYAALLVFFGRLADRHRAQRRLPAGRGDLHRWRPRRCAAAISVPMLVAFRLVQAAGAALLTPTSLGLVLASLPGRAARRRGAGLDGDRRPGRGPRPGGRRPAGRHQLALGVLRQRADRPSRPGRGLAQAAGRARAPGPRPDAVGASW